MLLRSAKARLWMKACRLRLGNVAANRPAVLFLVLFIFRSDVSRQGSSKIDHFSRITITHSSREILCVGAVCRVRGVRDPSSQASLSGDLVCRAAERVGKRCQPGWKSRRLTSG